MVKRFLLISSIYLLCIAITLTAYQVVSAESTKSRNDSPIVGVLAQEMSYHLNTKWPGVYSSYIAASYIKFVEGGGARAVPIWIGRSKEYYEEILGKINGVLFPGGNTFFNESNGYADAGRHIYDIAVRMNDNNEYMPLFGTCLGFELLLFLSAGSKEFRAKCNSTRRSVALNFTTDFRKSQIFGLAPDDVINILNTESVTPNFHTFCLTEQNVTDFEFERQWSILSWSKDLQDLPFVSSIEHKRYPFFGVQFHPEKVIYEWIRHRNISHTPNAIKACQYFANFFVNQTRKNLNTFSGVDEENRMLIYNYPVTFTSRVKSAFMQSYLFTNNTGYESAVEPSSGNGTMPKILNFMLLGTILGLRLFI